MDDKRKYSLELTEAQAGIVMNALDLYARIGMGQLDEILTHPDLQRALVRTGEREASDDLIAELKRTLLGLGSNASHGIFSEAISDSNRVAVDIFRALRHRLAMDRAGNPAQRDWHTMFGVEFDEPLATSKEGVPTIRLVDPEHPAPENSALDAPGR